MSRIYDALKRAERERHAARQQAQARARTERRSGPRKALRVPLFVYGNSGGKPFLEPAESLDVSANGCALMFVKRVRRGQKLLLLNCHNEKEQECIVARVDWKDAGGVQVGVQLTRPAPDFWREAGTPKGTK